MQIVEISKVKTPQLLKEVKKALQQGKVLACPTDTVYIWMVDATNRKAVQKVFQIKGREPGKPLPIFVRDIAMAKKFACISPKQEKAYVKKFWPGKYTFVLESKGILPKETGTKEKIGLRIPKHSLVQAILQETKMPLTGTSANLSGEPPLRDSTELIEQFSKKKHAPDIVLHAGKLPYSRPSQVIDITGNNHKVLRP
jgi:L-threonylcarbamoyladenylate synthase